MKFVKSKLRPLLLVLPLLILSYSASCQKTLSSSVSCTDSVRALTRSWFSQKLRADSLSKSLTDSVVSFRQFRRKAVVQKDSAYYAGYQEGKKDGTKAGKRYGRRQVIGLGAVAVILKEVARNFIFTKK